MNLIKAGLSQWSTIQLGTNSFRATPNVPAAVWLVMKLLRQSQRSLFQLNPVPGAIRAPHSPHLLPLRSVIGSLSLRPPSWRSCVSLAPVLLIMHALVLYIYMDVNNHNGFNIYTFVHTVDVISIGSTICNMWYHWASFIRPDGVWLIRTLY